MVESPPPMFCSKCGAQVSPNGRFCSSCGQALEPDTGTTLLGDEPSLEGATIAPETPSPRRTPSTRPSTPTPRTPTNPLTSSDPIGGGRFTPGQIIAQRYRVVALAGRGGMGEVYRARDSRLKRDVAIKILPDEFSRDADRINRFQRESVILSSLLEGDG